MHVELRLIGRRAPINYFKAACGQEGNLLAVKFTQKDGREVSHLYPLANVFRVRTVADIEGQDEGPSEGPDEGPGERSGIMVPSDGREYKGACNGTLGPDD